MSITIAYTITHTGGTFLCNLIKSNFNEKDFFWRGERFFQNRGRDKRLEDNECSSIDTNWLQNTCFKYLDTEERNTPNILIHGHYKNKHSPLMTKLLGPSSVQLPVIISLRDPLLSLNTSLWRHYAVNNESFQDWSIEKRESKIRDLIDRYINILYIPAERRFLFPVDIISNKNIEDKIFIANDLFKFCKIKMNKSALDYIYNWKPLGLTKNGTLLHTRDNGVELFNKSKKAIIENDKKELQKIFKIEYDILNQDKDLKNLLKSIGYSNLSWW